MNNIKIKFHDLNLQERTLFFIIFILYFQIVRNISLVLYSSFLLIGYLFLLISSKGKIQNHNKIYIERKYFIFLFSIFFILLLTFIYTKEGDYFTVFSRIMVTLPFIVFICSKKDFSFNFVFLFLKYSVYYFLIAGLSIPFQIIFGKIPFFVDSYYRAGLVRYTSMVGSLTAYGTIGVFPILIILFYGDKLFGKTKKLIYLIVIIMCMLTTLQKAAMINMILAFLLYLVLKKNKNLIRLQDLLIYLFVFIICIFIIWKSPILDYIMSIFEYTFDNESNTLSTDFFERLWERPKKVYLYHDFNLFTMLIGKGYSVLAGTVGLSKLPMAHNNYFDLLFSGGILHFISFIYLITSNFKYLICKTNNNIVDIFICFLIIILFNMLAGSATFYQPVFCVVIFLSIKLPSICFKGEKKWDC